MNKWFVWTNAVEVTGVKQYLIYSDFISKPGQNVWGILVCMSDPKTFSKSDNFLVEFQINSNKAMKQI
jgi:hypothetical protein